MRGKQHSRQLGLGGRERKRDQRRQQEDGERGRGKRMCGIWFLQ
uniref:Uncharacterized protein n=1 Tax=Arundo donax TaxID=35708 RepID=A0A0A9GIK7_ARUDO